MKRIGFQNTSSVPASAWVDIRPVVFLAGSAKLRSVAAATRLESSHWTVPVYHWLVIFSLLVLCVAESLAAGFEVEGQLDIESLTVDSTVRFSGRYAFIATVSSNKWVMKIDYAPNHYEVYGCDGTNVYSYLSDQRSANVGRCPGKIVRGCYPLLATYHVTVPWYAFAFTPSSHPAGGGKMPAPWYMAGADPLADSCTVRTKTLDPLSPASLCSDIEFCFSHERVEHPETNLVPMKLLAGVTVQRPSDLKRLIPDGQVMAVYKVLEVTNFAGNALPKRFELTYFNDRSFTNALRARTHFVGSISRVSNPSVFTFVPQITNTVNVADYRYQNLRIPLAGIQYDVSDGIWPPEDSVRLRQIFADSTGYPRKGVHPLGREVNR